MAIASNKETKDNDITLSLQETTESQEDSDIDHIQSPEASPVTGGENKTIEEDDNNITSVEESTKKQEPEESGNIIKEEIEEIAEDVAKINEKLQVKEESGKKGKKRKRTRSAPRKNPDQESFLCELCDFQSKRKDPFMNHYQYEHEGVKYKCSQCSLEYKTKKYLQTHVKSVHEGVKYPSIPVARVTTRLHRSATSRFTLNQFMKGSDTHAFTAPTKQHKEDI